MGSSDIPNMRLERGAVTSISRNSRMNPKLPPEFCRPCENLRAILPHLH
jgi:hypothetical protein